MNQKGDATMKKGIVLMGWLLPVLFVAPAGFCAYEHEGERDAANFLAVYPEKAGTKLDHCSLCHSGGSYKDNKGKTVTLGSCQWCHYSYGYDGSGDIATTINAYGHDYQTNGRSTSAIEAIKNLDSDGDTFSNEVEIEADRFPGNSTDDPTKVPAPFRVYTRAQLEAMGTHTQFLLMNTSRSGDYYAEYTGIPMEDLLKDAGMLDTATAIRVYAPDGFATDHPLDEEPTQNVYHVRGIYPEAVYHYNEQADQAINESYGWCDYSAPSCRGRNEGDLIAVPDGLKMILAYKREGAYLDPGILNAENKLDGEGPLRVVPPQKVPGPPDQLSTSSVQDVVWPYDSTADHNAGFSSRSVTIIKVLPMPEGTTDINVYEAGWNYVDQNKIIIYGAIDGTDSNGNGVLDSEEGTSDPDPKTARVRQANGADRIVITTSAGELTKVEALNHDDPSVNQAGKPVMAFPYGITHFEIMGLAPGSSVVVNLVFPGNVPTTAIYYKISPVTGWQEIAFGSNDGDNTITLTLKDGDPRTDADGIVNGTIVDPGALATSGTPTVASSGGGGGGCFIDSLNIQSSVGTGFEWPGLAFIVALFGLAKFWKQRRN
jgi:hypothetical protein